mmetsp:Transcript_6064/g.12769  ORF Transcript_6064/g.12769 Transcript_6064/m.12769 type:complete len:84 (-) Transcript_6064:88-339(-)
MIKRLIQMLTINAVLMTHQPLQEVVPVDMQHHTQFSRPSFLDLSLIFREQQLLHTFHENTTSFPVSSTGTHIFHSCSDPAPQQ